MARLHYVDALDRSGLLAALARFDPHVAGTPPLGLDLPDSDIDVLCHVDDALSFARAVWDFASGLDSFTVHQWIAGGRPVVASFRADGWQIEVFGDARPVGLQEGWRHFEVERRLLALGGEDLRAAVMKRRRDGMKTEPAFADVLRLDGDPYVALLDLEAASDDALAQMLRSSRL
jgi:hypothetical protein